jgi:hypothetical protein
LFVYKEGKDRSRSRNHRRRIHIFQLSRNRMKMMQLRNTDLNCCTINMNCYNFVSSFNQTQYLCRNRTEIRLPDPAPPKWYGSTLLRLQKTALLNRNGLHFLSPSNYTVNSTWLQNFYDFQLKLGLGEMQNFQKISFYFHTMDA